MNSKQAGFSLIELMVTVAIIGILAAVGLPAYADHVAKSKVSELLLAASQCRTVIAEGYQVAEASPGPNAWGCESATPSSKYVGSISTDSDGIITVVASAASDLPAALQGTSITLTPTDASGAALTFTPGTIVGGFSCQPGTMPAKYLPGSCRG